jgi:signal transduction histidine kinase
MYNLVSNAVKFTPEGGHISIYAERDDSVLRVSISDDGIGISAADQSRVFDGFQQINPLQARPYQGAGIGLALTKRIVELHGGTIGVISELGQGSIFIFTLPLVDGKSVSEKLEARILNEQGRN